jgi:hypothetical protein
LPRPIRWWWIAIPSIVAIALAAVLAIIAIHTQDLRDALKISEQEQTHQVILLSEAQRALETLGAQDVSRATLTTPQGRQPHAQIVYQPSRGRLVLLAGNLEPLTPGHIYQAWLYRSDDNPPLPAGTFVPDERGHASLFMAMPPNLKPARFEVTIEPTGGAFTPTTAPVLAGSVR